MPTNSWCAKTNYLEAYPERCQAENVVSRRNSIILVRKLVTVIQFAAYSGANTRLSISIYEGMGEGTQANDICTQSDISNVKITCELTGSGESESIYRDEREQPGINTRNWEPRTPPRPRPVLGKITGFRIYQTRSSGGTLFSFLNSKSDFLKACTNGEQFIKSEIGMEYLLFPLFYLLLPFSLHPV